MEILDRFIDLIRLAGWAYTSTAVGLLVLRFVFRDRKKVSKLQEKVDEFCINSKLYIRKKKNNKDILLAPTLIAEKELSYGYKLVFLLPSGLSLKDFESRQEALEAALKAEVEMWALDNRIHMEVMTEKLPNRIEFKEGIIEKLEHYKLGFPIGYSRSGLQILDFTKVPHLLVGGESGSGKSVFIRQGIYSMSQVYSPQYLQIRIIDLKGGLEAAPFANLPHVKIAKNFKEAEQLITDLNQELNCRIKRLKELGVNDIHFADIENMPYILVIYDEFAELSCCQDMLAGVQRLHRLARFAGIHQILATQRPDAKVLPGQSKANIPATVAFRVRNRVNSQILLDNDRAAHLPRKIPGRAIYQYDRDMQIQVPYLEMPKITAKLPDNVIDLEKARKDFGIVIE